MIVEYHDFKWIEDWEEYKAKLYERFYQNPDLEYEGNFRVEDEQGHLREYRITMKDRSLMDELMNAAAFKENIDIS